MEGQQGITEFLSQHKALRVVALPAGVTVCDQGDQCDSLVVLTSGRVKVFRLGEDGRRITLYQITAGQGCVLTASCLLNNRRFPAIAVTEEPCQGYVISKQQLKQWMLEQPVWQAFIFDLLSARMGDLIAKVDQLAFDTLEQRLLQWLQQHPQAPRVCATHQQVAEELASSREVVSRLLKKMEQAGQLSCHRGEIELHPAL